MSGKSKHNENIQVYVRCRPINSRERNIHSQEAVKVVSDREVVIKQQPDNRMTKKFTFDRAFGPDSKQEDVYQVVVAPLITEVLSGYNCTVFAYGQTGTGKTHTMIGHELAQDGLSPEDASKMGIIPRALSHMFEELRSMDVEYTMRISYLELYNEELCDLLSSSDVTQIRIFEDPNKKGSIIVQGLEEVAVQSTAEVYKLLAKGQEKRRMATTLMNAQSSRSHTVFSILVHIKEKDGIEGEELMKIGKLNLVDLAGSENICKAGNEKGIRSRETVNINQSLLTLGRVITALVERTPHIPYRESKLTRLLQESLGGRTKTSIIATISPGHKDLEETTSTLEYANRAKNIQNKPEVNQKLTKKTVLKEYTEEITRLQRDLMAARDKNGIFLPEETYNQMNYQLESQKAELIDRVNQVKAEKEKVAEHQKALDEISVELNSRTKQLGEIGNMLTQTTEDLEKAKRGYQEKKMIIQKQGETEQKLTSHVKQLIVAADDMTKDNSKLHEHIDRRKTYESNNLTACKNLATSLSGHFDTMTTNIQKYKTTHNEQTLSLVNRMGTKTSESKELCAAMISQLTTLIDVENQGKSSIEECLAAGKREFTEIFMKHMQQKETIIKEYEEEREALMNKYVELQTNVDQSYKHLEQNTNILKDQQEKHFEFVGDHMKTVRQKMITNSDATVEKIEVGRHTIVESTAKNDELTSRFDRMLDEMKVLVAEKRNQNQVVRGVAHDLDTVQTKIKLDLEENLGVFNKVKDEVSNNQAAMVSTLGEFESATNNIKLNMTVMNRVGTESEQRFVAAVQEIDRNFTEQKDALTNNLYEIFNQIESSCEMTHIDIDSGLNRIVKDVSEEEKRIKDHQFEFDDTMTTLETLQKELHETVNGGIEFCIKRLDTFQSNELQTYQPTGQTPFKREYKFPRVLAATAPHKKLITEFWDTHNPEDLNCSAIMPEDATDMDTTVIEQTDRTLCENQSFNANSISTPVTNTSWKHIPAQNLSNIEVVNGCEHDKEN